MLIAAKVITMLILIAGFWDNMVTLVPVCQTILDFATEKKMMDVVTVN